MTVQVNEKVADTVDDGGVDDLIEGGHGCELELLDPRQEGGAEPYKEAHGGRCLPPPAGRARHGRPSHAAPDLRAGPALRAAAAAAAAPAQHLQDVLQHKGETSPSHNMTNTQRLSVTTTRFIMTQEPTVIVILAKITYLNQRHIMTQRPTDQCYLGGDKLPVSPQGYH